MLSAGVIEPSTSNYHSPVIFVPKKSGGYRFCVDYRKLNNATADEISILPPIDDIIRSLGDSKIFTLLDLKSGYWQVPLDDDSRHLTTFSGPDGATYQFRVMPFGLKNAPATFQKLMVQEVLTDLVNVCVKVYLDDIMVYSRNEEEHQRHLHQVLERLQHHQLFASTEKCHIAVRDVDYLGYRITATGNTINTKHVEQIQQMKPPTTRKELRSVLGLFNWFREFIPNYSSLVSPLTDLLQQNKKFRMNDEAMEAFQEVKTITSSPLELKRPTPNLEFHLQTDASKRGVGAVLYQLNNSGHHLLRQRKIPEGRRKLPRQRTGNVSRYLGDKEISPSTRRSSFPPEN